MKRKFQKRLVRSLLGLMLVATTFLGNVTAAAISGLTYYYSEVKTESAFKTSGSWKIFDISQLVEGNNGVPFETHWAKSSAVDLVSLGVLYAAESSGKYSIVFDDPINGKDALGLSMYYYWSTVNSNKNKVASGATTRQLSYTNAGSLFDTNTKMSNGYGRDIATRSTIYRREAFYIIANCISKKSGTTVKLSDFSDTRLGYPASGEKLLNNVQISGSTMKIQGDTISDYWSAQDALRDDYMRAANMLIHLGVLKGQSVGGTVSLNVNKEINYSEFYSLLVTVDSRGYDEGDVPQYSEITPGLSVSGGNTTIGYKDILNGQTADVSVTLNSSSTTSRMPVTSRKYTYSDSYGNGTTKTNTSTTLTDTFAYGRSDLGYTTASSNKGDKTYSIPVSGSVVITDSLGATATRSASGTNTVNVVNYAPTANLTATTDRLDSPFNKLFYYIGEPITIKDYSSDPEGALTAWSYAITRSGSLVASSDNFNGVIKNDSVVTSFTTPSSMTHSITFAQPGSYTVTATCTDELGKTGTYSYTMRVTGEPAPPIAIIKGNANTFANYNTTFTDASTDLNDDIVAWNWGKDILYFDEVMDENGDGTGEGEWVAAKSGEHYTGALNDSYRNGSGSYTTAAGTLQFKKYGTYRISLKVTDATGFSDETTHDINVLEDIPIIIVEPQPNQPNNYYTVTFVNSNDVVSSTQVMAGSTTPADKVPNIINIGGYTEHGWTQDGKSIVEPTSVVVNGNITFCVLLTQEDENENLHTVTFINTDGTRAAVKVPHSGTVPQSEIPAIVDDPDLNERGWTRDGIVVVDPASVSVVSDIVFWVQSDVTSVPGGPDSYEPYFVDEVLYVKQNRSAIIDVSKSLNPPGDPIQTAKTEWVMSSVDGYDLTNVKWEQTDPAGRLTNTFLAKEPGKFRVTITLHNNYSDVLAVEKPNSTKLQARTATITVVVYPDVDPQAALFVNNANPNFHTNPTSVNVTVASSALSPDYDSIGTYKWVIYRDTNNNGRYDDETPIYQKSGKSLPSVTFPVEFKSGIVGRFKAVLEVSEEFGQATINKFITSADTRYTTTEKEFEVNWTPCISFDLKYDGNAWAYVDDTISVSTLIKDESTMTVTTEWRLRRQTGTGYEYVDTSAFDVWSLSNPGGKLRIPADGNYALAAKVTDDHGYSETFVSNTIRIYNFPTAVISDDAAYRWNDAQWQYKQSRRFDLDGVSSYAEDSTGPALHQIDHSQDTWAITPLTGGVASDIYVLANDGVNRMSSSQTTYFCATRDEFDEQIAITAPGTYRISYQVTNTHGKQSAVATQTITILEDSSPLITGICAPTVLRGTAGEDGKAPLGIKYLLIQSKDYDMIGSYSIAYKYDSNNNGSFADETWVTMAEVAKGTDGQPSKNGHVINVANSDYIEAAVSLNTPDVGKYEFRVFAKETFGQPTLPIVPDSTRKATEKLFETEADNVAPNGTFDVANTVYGDVVFAMGRMINDKQNRIQSVSDKSLSFASSFGDIPGANLFHLNVQTVKTSTITAETSFPWKVYNLYGTGLGTGDGQFNAVGKDYYYRGYGAEGPIDHLYYDDGQNDARKFTFDIDMTGYNSCATVIPAFMFGCKESGNTFTGYIAMMWHDKVSVYSFTSTNGHAGLTANGVGVIAVSNGLSDWTYGAASFKFIKSAPTVSTSLQKSVTMKFKNGILTVTDGAKDVLEVACPDTGNGYGVAAVNSTHGCGERSYTKFKNFALENGTVNTLFESMPEISSRPGHSIFIVWTEETIPKELDTNSSTYKEDSIKLIYILNSKNIHLIVFGSETNRAAMDKLLNQCSSPGIFLNTGSVDTDLQKSREFIASILGEAPPQNTKYILVDEDVNYTKYFYDVNGDKQWLLDALLNKPSDLIEFWRNPSFLAQKWRYAHDENYFDNSLGKFDFSDEWQAKEVTSFTKVGKYSISYKIKDNPLSGDNSPSNPFDNYRYWSSDYDGTSDSNLPAELYVHRRPIADFKFKVIKANGIVDSVQITDAAYDQDHQYSDAVKGINRWEWKWKFTDDSEWRGEGIFEDGKAAETWINNELKGLRTQSSSDIMIQYRVRDIDGPAGIDDPPRVTAKPIMGNYSSTQQAYYNPVYKDKITTIQFATTANVPATAVASWDVSEAKDNSVLAWIINDGTGGYALTIGAKGGPIAPASMSRLFLNFTKLEYVDFSGISTINTTDMSSMFSGCVMLTSVNASALHTENVSNMSSLFSNCIKLTTINISGWDTSNVNRMDYMFQSCSSLTQLDVSNFKTEKVSSFFQMFYNCSKLKTLNVSNWDTSNAIDMGNMFLACGALTQLDVSNFKTGRVTSFNQMFNGCTNLVTINVSRWDTSNVTNMSRMFLGCSSITQLDVSNFKTGKVSSFLSMFNNCLKLTTLNVSNWDTSNAYDMSGMFQNCKLLTALDVSRWNTSNVIYMDALFYSCDKLTSLDVSKWDTSNVITMAYMFGCDVSIGSYSFIGYSNLRSLNVGNWNVSKVQYFNSMFSGCYQLSSLDVGRWDTSSATDTSFMFAYCHGLSAIDVSNWKMGKVIQATCMFASTGSSSYSSYSRLTTLDVSKWDTSSMQSINSMFSWQSISSINVSNWNTSKVSNMNMVFWACMNINSLDISRWDVSNVTDFYGMFQASRCSSLDFSKWKNNKATDIGMMFNNAYRLNSIDLSWLDCSNLINTSGTFSGASSLGAVYVNSQSDYNKLTSLGGGAYFVVRPRTTGLMAISTPSLIPTSIMDDDGSHGGLPIQTPSLSLESEQPSNIITSTDFADIQPQAFEMSSMTAEDRKHLQGVWSMPNVVIITSSPMKPIAIFAPSSNSYDIGETIAVEESSYSPNGDNIAKWEWEIERVSSSTKTAFTYTLGQGGIFSSHDVSLAASQAIFTWIDKQQLGLTNIENTYKITLKVTDDKPVTPLISDPYTVSIIIKPSNKPPTAVPNDPGSTKSVYKKDGVLVYQYDPYDANTYNPFYTYGGIQQLRGTEIIDWTLILDDPDNHDVYGTANDSDKYLVSYLMELFKDRSIALVTEDRTTTSHLEFGKYTVTAMQALVNSNLAPFISAKTGNLSWGAYRITTTVTDVPNNGSEGKSISIKTSNNTIPKHLYVIPALSVNDIHVSWSESEGLDTTEPIPVGDTIIVTFVTNAETVGARVKMPTGDGTVTTTNATQVSTDVDGTKHWSASVTIPNDLEEDDLVNGTVYTFSVEGWTDYGLSSGQETRTKAVSKSLNVLTLKLYDFNITDIADPGVGFDGNPVFVPNLAYDASNSPKGTLTKLGYAVYFELSSKGMRNDTDSLAITPHFYGYNETTNRYDIPLDVYYKIKSGYVSADYTGKNSSIIQAQNGAELGTLSRLTLNKDNRITNGTTQQWAGLYGLPSTAVFIKHGGSVNSTNDRWADTRNKGVLITFDIDALKSGSSKYSYVARGQWALERKNGSGSYLNPSKSFYQDGAVIVLDGKHSAVIDDFESRPVWRRS